MTTDHINRWNAMDDIEFLKHVQLYRKFNNTKPLEHNINLDYIVKRCDRLGYDFGPGCCGKYYLTKR